MAVMNEFKEKMRMNKMPLQGIILSLCVCVFVHKYINSETGNSNDKKEG